MSFSTSIAAGPPGLASLKTVPRTVLSGQARTALQGSAGAASTRKVPFNSKPLAAAIGLEPMALP